MNIKTANKLYKVILGILILGFSIYPGFGTSNSFAMLFGCSLLALFCSLLLVRNLFDTRVLSNNGYRGWKIALTFAFIIYFSAAWWGVTEGYFVPSQNIFHNADYHYIYHKGYVTNDSAVLVDDKYSTKSLLNDLSGEAVITKVGTDSIKLKLKNISAPFFVAKEEKEETEFVNPYFKKTFLNKFTLTNNHLSFQFEIFFINENKVDYKFQINGKTSHSQFTDPLKSGFPNLRSILQDANAEESVVNSVPWLENTMVIKDGYSFGKDKSSETGTRYHLFPSEQLKALLQSGQLSLQFDDTDNPAVINQSEFSIISKYLYFRSGTQLDSDPLFKAMQKKEQLDLDIVSPIRNYKLFADTIPNQIKLGITSQSDYSLWHTSYILKYDMIELPESDYNINGILTYISDGPGVSISPCRILDFNSKDSFRIREVQTGQDFLLATKKNLHSKINLFWKFRIDNFAEDNPTNKTWIKLFPIWFLICFFMYVAAVYGKRYFNFSVVEMLCHTTLLLLLSFKLWLLWRMHCFPPSAAEGTIKMIGIEPLLGKVTPESFAFITPPIIYLIIILSQRYSIFFSRVIAALQRKIIQMNEYFGGGGGKLLKLWNYLLSGLVKMGIFLMFGGIILISKKSSISVGLTISLLVVWSFYLIYLVCIYFRGMGLKVLAVLAFILCSYFADRGLTIIFVHAFCLFYVFYYTGTTFFSAKIVKQNYASRLKKITKIALLSFSISFLIPYTNLLLWKTFASLKENSIKTIKRAEILSEDPEVVYLRSGVSESGVSSFFNAYDNIQFINYYSKNDSKKQIGNFRILEHKQTAVKFKDQASDLVVSRYIIAEHGFPLLSIVLTLLFFPLLIYYRILPNPIIRDRRKYFYLSLFGSVLLFDWAFYVYASNNNILPFVGQDFPVLSLLSYTTYFVPIIILSFIIVFFNHEKKG